MNTLNTSDIPAAFALQAPVSFENSNSEIKAWEEQIKLKICLVADARIHHLSSCDTTGRGCEDYCAT